MKNKFINKEIYYSVVLLCTPLIVLFGIYFYSNQEDYGKSSLLSELEGQAASVIQINEDTTSPFDEINIEAKSAVVKDLNSGEILYSKNATTPMPLASITKVVTALTVLENVDNLDESVYITASALMTDGNTFLSLGEIFRIRDLLDYVLITSSNHGTEALVENIENKLGIDFVSEMNELSRSIGMKNSHFLNATGLDNGPNIAGSFGTALDVATLFEFALENQPEIFETTKDIEFNKLSQSGILHRQSNTNQIIPLLKNMLASKTGFTALAGGNLAVIVDPGLNRPIVIVVLSSTREGRFEDVLKLSGALYDYFDYQASK